MNRARTPFIVPSRSQRLWNPRLGYLSTAAESLRYGFGGNGPPPFLYGTGGNGPPPFAIITEPSLCPATMVFRPIAPANTSMARSRAASLRDIRCLRGRQNPECTLYLTTPMSSSSRDEPVPKSTRPPASPFRQVFAWSGGDSDASCNCMLSFRTCSVNGTVVLGAAPFP